MDDFALGAAKVSWDALFAALISQDIVDETTLMLDSTIIKVHQHALERSA